MLSQLLLYVKKFTRIVVNFFCGTEIFGKSEADAFGARAFAGKTCRGGGRDPAVREQVGGRPHGADALVSMEARGSVRGEH